MGQSLLFNALDDAHLWAAVKYIELNPVREKMVRRAENYAWSSARAHVYREADPLLSPRRPFTDRRLVRDWSAWLAEGLKEELLTVLRQNTRTGRPSGSEGFIDRLEAMLDRMLRPHKRGPRGKRE